MKIFSVKYTGRNLDYMKKLIKKPIKLIGEEDDYRGYTLAFESDDKSQVYVVEPGGVIHFKGRKIVAVNKGKNRL